MRYELELDGRREFIEIYQQDGKIRASIADRNYDLDVTSPEPGVYLLFLDDHVFEARVSPFEDRAYEIKLQGQSFRARIIDRKHARIASDQSEGGQRLLTAPMPGKVVKVLRNAGEEVAAGQGVVVVEAMKMQNEVKSPRAGRVTEIRVQEGMTVTANQVLAVVE